MTPFEFVWAGRMAGYSRKSYNYKNESCCEPGHASSLFQQLVYKLNFEIRWLTSSMHRPIVLGVIAHMRFISLWRLRNTRPIYSLLSYAIGLFYTIFSLLFCLGSSGVVSNFVQRFDDVTLWAFLNGHSPPRVSRVTLSKHGCQKVGLLFSELIVQMN
jgi:hypothetical protein